MNLLLTLSNVAFLLKKKIDSNDDLTVEHGNDLQYRVPVPACTMFIICCYGERCCSSSMMMKRVVHPLVLPERSLPLVTSFTNLLLPTLRIPIE